MPATAAGSGAEPPAPTPEAEAAGNAKPVVAPAETPAASATAAAPETTEPPAAAETFTPPQEIADAEDRLFGYDIAADDVFDADILVARRITAETDAGREIDKYRYL